MIIDNAQIGQIVWTPLGLAWVIAIYADDDIVKVRFSGGFGFYRFGFYHPESLVPLGAFQRVPM